MKRILCLLLIILFIPSIVYADSGLSTIVMDVDSGRILYSKDVHTKRLIASITKIMTCIIVLENMDLNSEVVVGDEVLKMYGTNIYIEKGERLTVRDLLYGLMLRSGNDAAITLAVQSFGDSKLFVDKMNEKAKEIGMNDTVFVNPHGLDDDTKNYSTAYDMALLSRYAYKNKDYRKIVSTKRLTTKSSLKTYTWYNRMNLLGRYKYCIGGKNGYTPKAGKTLVSLAKKDNLTLTIVSLDDSDVYTNHEELYEKYFDLYKNYTILDKNKLYLDSHYMRGDFYIKKSFSYPLLDEEIDKTTTLIELYDNPKDNIYGRIIVKVGDNEIGGRKIYRK